MSAVVADVGAAPGGSTVQALLVVVLFVAAMALLPWLLRRLKQRQAALGGAGAAAAAARVLSAVSVGPQQRVVTVEVGAGEARTCLVLGVTAQHIACLHVLPVALAETQAPAAPAAAAAAGTAPPGTGFLQALARARGQLRAAGAPSHG